MLSETEIKELYDELSIIVDRISEAGSTEESGDEDVDFASDVLDTLEWILEKISTEEFTKEPYLNLNKLRETVKTTEDCDVDE